MNEQELIEQLTDKVAETIADSEMRLGYWREITDAGARSIVLYYVRMAGFALTVLAPMIAERDTQIEQLRRQLGGGPDAA